MSAAIEAFMIAPSEKWNPMPATVASSLY